MQSDGKLTALAELLLNNSDYLIGIESHTDNTGPTETLQTLTDTRARRIFDKFASLGVAENRMTAKGYGGTLPVAQGTTAAIKAKNRRVNIILDLNLQ